MFNSTCVYSKYLSNPIIPSYSAYHHPWHVKCTPFPVAGNHYFTFDSTFLAFTYEKEHMVLVFLWLAYFIKIKIYHPIHFAASVKISFFLCLNSTPLCVCVFINSSVAHRSWFYVSFIRNSHAMNLAMLISLWLADFISIEFRPRNGISGTHGRSILNFWGISTLFSIICALIHTPSNSAWVHFPPYHCQYFDIHSLSIYL